MLASARKRMFAVPRPVETAPSVEMAYSIGNGAAKGVWYSIHLMAANGYRTALIDFLHLCSLKFMCAKCRPHIRDAAFFPDGRTKVPDPDLPDAEKRRALFDWSVAFHNAVSARINGEDERAGRRPAKVALSPAESDRLFAELTGDGCQSCKPPSTEASAPTTRFISSQ